MANKLFRSLVLCAALFQPGTVQSLEEKVVDSKAAVERVEKKDIPNSSKELKPKTAQETVIYRVLTSKVGVELDNGSRILGQNGFSMFPVDKDRIKLGEQSIPYAYHNGKNLLPKKESLERQLSDYLAYSLYYNSNSEPQPDTFKKERMVDTRITIDRESLKITAIFPRNYAYSPSVTLSGGFKITQDVKHPLGEFYDIAREIVESEIRNPDELPVDVFKKNKNKYRFSMANSGNDVVYVITAREKYHPEKPEFSVMFANHFVTPRNYNPNPVENLTTLKDFSKLPRLELSPEQKELFSVIKKNQ